MSVFETIHNRLRDIVVKEFRNKPDVPFGERLDQIQSSLRDTDLNQEFKKHGTEIQRELNEELAAVENPEIIHINTDYPGPLGIQGGMLDIPFNFSQAFPLINNIVDYYFSLLIKQIQFRKANANVNEIIELDEKVRTEEKDLDGLGEYSYKLVQLAQEDPIIQAEFARMYKEEASLEDIADLNYLKSILLKAISNSGIRGIKSLYQDQYECIASYLGDLARATKTHVIDPIKDCCKSASKAREKFSQVFEELVDKKSRFVAKYGQRS